jgi:uncharacterized protein (DUF305 family)
MLMAILRWLAVPAAILILSFPPGAQAQERPPPVTVQPGAPGSESRTLTADELVATEARRHTEADVRFMQDMIHHHEQALVMSRLAPARTARSDLLTLAARIERAQADEILQMKRWLEVRDEDVPDVSVELAPSMASHAHRAAPGHEPVPAEPRATDHAAHAHGHHGRGEDEHAMMAGMLTPEQLQELADAQGEEFDRLFLEFMIYHHQGALKMVDELFAAPGAAYGSEIFHFASDVANDQQGEIARMRGMLVTGS